LFQPKAFIEIFENSESCFSFVIQIDFFSARDLVRGLLRKNPKKRLTATQIMEHPWVTGERKFMDDLDGLFHPSSSAPLFPPSTPYPPPFTLHPPPSTFHLPPSTLHPPPSTPPPSTLHPTLHPPPSTLSYPPLPYISVEFRDGNSTEEEENVINLKQSVDLVKNSLNRSLRVCNKGGGEQGAGSRDQGPGTREKEGGRGEGRSTQNSLSQDSEIPHSK
jgi:serine/threonine protein kinase